MQTKPKYKFGKLPSKYHIIDIFTHSYTKSEVLELFWNISTSLRKLSVNEYYMIPDIKLNHLEITFKENSEWLQNLLRPTLYNEFNDYKFTIPSSQYLNLLAGFIRPWHRVKELVLPSWDPQFEE